MMDGALRPKQEQATESDLEALRRELEQTKKELAEARGELSALREEETEPEEEAEPTEEEVPPEEDLPPQKQELPPFSTMAKNLFRAAGRAAGSAIRGRRVLADEETMWARLAACRSAECGCYIPMSDRCTECGCFVSAKAKLATERCPHGFWPDPPLDVEAKEVGESEAPEKAEELEETHEPQADPEADEEEQIEPIELDEIEEPPASEKQPELTAVLFSDPGCRACGAARELLDRTRAHPGLAHLEVTEIDITEERLVARQYGVRAVPTLLYFHSQEFVHRREGLPSEAELIADLQGLGADVEGIEPAVAPSRMAPSPWATPEPYVHHPYSHARAAQQPPAQQHQTQPFYSLEVEQARAELALLGRSDPYGGGAR